MPRVKKIFIKQHRDTVDSWRKGLDAVIFVNVAGKFYCDLPDAMKLPLRNVFDSRHVEVNTEKGTVRVLADTLDAIESGIRTAYEQYTKPVIKKENVICYNIEAHVNFATDDKGNAFPNAGYFGASWNDRRESVMYGNHDATHAARGGYSIVVGATARTKTTYSYGGQDKISYEGYYKDGDHHGHENPAEKLNSWKCFNLGNDFKEIPYSDEAAEFFFNLMYGMAKLAQMIQSNTFEQEKLLALIYSGKYLMSGENVMQPAQPGEEAE